MRRRARNGGRRRRGRPPRSLRRAGAISAPRTPIDDYLEGVPPKFRALLVNLRRTIRAAAPDAQEVLSYRMPAFRWNGALVYFAAFREHCSLFPGSATVRRQFAAEIRPFETGKGTLRFTPERPLPDRLVTGIVKARMAENARRSVGRSSASVARRPRPPAPAKPERPRPRRMG